MTNTQHTPGPWAIKRDAMGRLVIASEAARPRTVGEIVDIYRGNPANARLIAASPETLAALEELVAAVESFALSRFEMDGIDTLICKTVRSRAAIAKATGQ